VDQFIAGISLNQATLLAAQRLRDAFVKAIKPSVLALLNTGKNPRLFSQCLVVGLKAGMGFGWVLHAALLHK
jgi:hypothetical protein